MSQDNYPPGFNPDDLDDNVSIVDEEDETPDFEQDDDE